MESSLKKLDNLIDEFLIWRRNNPLTIITSHQKNRLNNVLSQIINNEGIHQEAIQPQNAENKINTKSHDPNQIHFITCKYCGELIHSAYFKNHKKKCLDRSSNKNTIIAKKDNQKKNIPIPVKPRYPFDQIKTERKLDGSKDFYIRREQGRFGSHPLYDNMDENSQV